MTKDEALVKRILIALGDKELKQALDALYYHYECNDKGELHRANDLFTTLVRDALTIEPFLYNAIYNFITGIYMVVFNMNDTVALAYVQKNIMNNTLH